MNHDRNFLIIFQRIRGSYYHVFIHGLRTHDDYIPNSSNIYIPLKCLKSLAFCRNNGCWLMENHGLDSHKAKIYAKSSNRNTPNTPQLTHLPKSANYLEYFWKKTVITCPLSMDLTWIHNLNPRLPSKEISRNCIFFLFFQSLAIGHQHLFFLSPPGYQII